MESQAHKEYVLNAIDYIKRTFGVSDCEIATDLGDASMLPPKSIDGFRADIYVNTAKYVIIGEAKTDDDIIKNHTFDQFASYVKDVKAQDKERHIIMSGSMAAYPTIRNFIRRFRKHNDVPGITFHTVDPFKKGEVLK